MENFSNLYIIFGPNYANENHCFMSPSSDETRCPVVSQEEKTPQHNQNMKAEELSSEHY